MAVRRGRICPVCKGECRDDYGNRVKCDRCGSTGCVFDDYEAINAKQQANLHKELVTS